MSVNIQHQVGTCPYGGAFYKCGAEVVYFSGCCLIEPCVPGIGCPAEKDRTPGRFSSTLRTTTAAMTTTTKEPGVTFVMLPVSTTPVSSPVISSTVLSAVISGSIRSSSLPTTTEGPNENVTNTPGHSGPKALPIAAIAGAGVGGLVLLVLGLLLLLQVRRRKRENVYQAPIYVSPFNTSSDMTQQSRASPWKEFDHILKLDGRNSASSAEQNSASPRQFAELPAEPIARRF